MTELLLAILLVGMAPPSKPATSPPDTVVVCPTAWKSTLQPWIDYRTTQGHRIVTISSQGSYQTVRAAIRQHARKGTTRAIVLIGDAPAAKTGFERQGNTVATQHVAARVNIHWGSEPLIASDNGYADLDNDGTPDTSIGRIPADSAKELATMIQRILAYEKPRPGYEWKRRINLVAGVGGFGLVTDNIIEATVRQFLTTEIPASYATTMTQASWHSAFCPDPRTFHQVTLQRLNEGCLFWIYMGHGQRNFLDQVVVPGEKRYPIFNRSHLKNLNAQGSPAIAILLACYSGAFDAPEDCLAEDMLRQPGGPVAVLAGSRMTMPYAMSVMAQGLIKGYFQDRCPTLGEIVLTAKQELISATPSTVKATQWNRRLLDTMARLLSPLPDLIEAERREHLALFNLLGDPLLRLPHPDLISVSGPPHVVAGGEVTIEVTSPWSGHATIELVCRRGIPKESISLRTAYDPTDQALRQYNQTYARANDQVWTRIRVPLAKGPGQFTIKVPANAKGSCFVRIIGEGANSYGMGSCPIFIRQEILNPDEPARPSSPKRPF
ncbi:MAG: C25 family cysteine peptidase [Pirellulaceae bacterium]